MRLILLLAFVMNVGATILPTNGMRIVPFGDSQSSPGASTPGIFPIVLGTWYIGRYPDVPHSWWCLAGSGLQVTNTYAASADAFGRSDKYIVPARPNLVTYKMTPNGAQATNVFADSLRRIVTTNWMATYTATGGGPGVFTNWSGATVKLLSTIPKNTSDGGATGTTAVKDRSLMHVGVANEIGIEGINLWSSLVTVQSNNFAGGEPYDLYFDSVHPLPAGHVGTANTTVFLLGEDGLVATSTINAAALTSSLKTNCTIGTVTGTSSNLSFTRLTTKVAASWPKSADADAIAAYTNTLWMNRDMLYVANLTESSTNYVVSINGTNCGSFSHTQLAAGINLTALPNGYARDQREEVYGLFIEAQGLNRTTFDPLVSPSRGVNKFVGTCVTRWNAGDRDQVLINALITVAAEVDAGFETVRAAAQPATLTFNIALPGTGGGGGEVVPAPQTTFSTSATISGAASLQ